MINGSVFTIATPNNQTIHELCKELQQLLNAGDADFENLCASEMINPSSKMKPVRSSDETTKSTTYRAKDGNCGFDISGALISNSFNLSGIANKYSGDKYNGWVYQHPRGNRVSPTEWNRMRDWDGYNHKASDFIGGWSAPSRYAKDITTPMSIAFVIPQSGSDALVFKDFDAVKNSYAGVAFVGSNGSIYRMTALNPIASSGTSISVSPSQLPADTYDIYPFFSSAAMTFSSSNSSSAKVYTMPFVKGRQIVIAEKSIVITITGSYSTLTRLNYKIVITNNGPAARTFSNNEIRARYPRNTSWNALKETNEVFVEGEPASFTVDANSSYTAEGYVIISDPELRQSTVLWVSLDGGGSLTEKITINSLTPMD